MFDFNGGNFVLIAHTVTTVKSKLLLGWPKFMYMSDPIKNEILVTWLQGFMHWNTTTTTTHSLPVYGNSLT